MNSFLSDTEYQEIFETLASTDRGQAFLNTFAAKHNSGEIKNLASSCNKLSDFAYSVAQDFSESDTPIEHDEQLMQIISDDDVPELPGDITNIAEEASAEDESLDISDLPDIGELVSEGEAADLKDLMVDTDEIEINFADDAEEEVENLNPEEAEIEETEIVEAELEEAETNDLADADDAEQEIAFDASLEPEIVLEDQDPAQQVPMDYQIPAAETEMDVEANLMVVAEPEAITPADPNEVDAQLPEAPESSMPQDIGPQNHDSDETAMNDDLMQELTSLKDSIASLEAKILAL